MQTTLQPGVLGLWNLLLSSIMHSSNWMHRIVFLEPVSVQEIFLIIRFFAVKCTKNHYYWQKHFFFQNCIHQLNECRQLFNQACLDCETFGVQILCTRPIECTASFFSNRSQLQISFWKIRIFSVKYAKNLYFFVELHVYFSQVLYPDRTERDTRRWVCVPPPHHHAIDGVCSCVYWLLL